MLAPGFLALSTGPLSHDPWLPRQGRWRQVGKELWLFSCHNHMVLLTRPQEVSSLRALEAMGWCRTQGKMKLWCSCSKIKNFKMTIAEH